MADIDRARFAGDVIAALARQGLSYRAAVARWPELNVALLVRSVQGAVLSAANFLVVCRCLALDPFAYLDMRRINHRSQHTKILQENQSVSQTVSCEAKRSGNAR